jgi:hypothetical protein
MRLLSLLALTLSTGCAVAQPLTTAFTYQGTLQIDGQIAFNAGVDVQFALYSSATGNTQLGSSLCLDEYTTDARGGLTALLDFGSQFAGQRRFLEIRVRPAQALGDCANPAGYVALTPRQEITAAPYATFAPTAGAAASATTATTAATATNATLLNNQPASFYTSAANLSTGTLTDARLSTNVPRLNVANTYTAPITAPTFIGALNGNATSATNAANLNSQPGSFYLNAGNMNAGTLPISRGGTNTTSIGVPGSVAISNGSSLTYSNLGFPGFYLRYNGGGSTAFSAILASDLPVVEGDATGTITATRVIGLQNRPISSTAPLSGQVLSFVSNAWRPTDLPQPSVINTGENVRIIRGTILTAGTISQGTGFTATRPAIGEYQITFSPPFAGFATVTATVFDTSVPQIATISQVNSSTVTIRIWSIAGAATNSDFHFVAVGPR